VALPPEALAELRAFAEQLCEVGDVWWLPSVYVQWFPGGKPRYVLVAGIEAATGGAPKIAHLIAGSTGASTSPASVAVPAGQGGLTRDTYFKFFTSGTLGVDLLHRDGRWVGRLPATVMPNVEAAVKSSRLVALKKVRS
jgi:mRNA-degrading endonuclease toxin of MazEF toxin-antitoxin module